MGDWKPRLRAELDPRTLPLDAEAGYLLSRIDGQTTVDALGLLTALPRERVELLLDVLVELGALEPPPDRPAPAGDEGAPETEGEADAGTQEGDAASHRARYAREYAKLPLEERLLLASGTRGEAPLALALDPMPQVIDALLRGGASTLAHARLVARHQATAHGLTALLANARYVRDAEIRRLLLRNGHLPESGLRAVLQGARLSSLYQVTANRDVPEVNRRRASSLLRARFSAATPEERAEVIVSSEGRVLPALVGLTLEPRTAALLCGRSYPSLLLAQQLARFPGTPTPLVKHLLQQPITKQQPGLRTLLLRHPHAPKRM